MLRLANRQLCLARPAIMAIVNVTSDSFSDGGRFLDVNAAIEHGLALIEDGADILDIGGESSRPGALPVSPAEEIDRVVPVVEAWRKHTDVIISVDTCRTQTARAALTAGADMINDIRAGLEPGMLSLVAKEKAGLVLMHMQGTPATMQKSPYYDNVYQDVASFLRNRMDAAVAAGIGDNSLLLDPGIGFGKNIGHNLELLRNLAALARIGPPVLLGISRKRFLAGLSGEKFGGEPANLAANLWGLAHGVKIFRVHEVKSLKQAFAVWQAIKGAN